MTRISGAKKAIICEKSRIMVHTVLLLFVNHVAYAIVVVHLSFLALCKTTNRVCITAKKVRTAIEY